MGRSTDATRNAASATHTLYRLDVVGRENVPARGGDTACVWAATGAGATTNPAAATPHRRLQQTSPAPTREKFPQESGARNALQRSTRRKRRQYPQMKASLPRR